MSEKYDLVITSTLPNLDVDFFEPSNNFKLYVNLVYGSTGKLLGITTTYSDDLLSKTDRLSFDSSATIDAYRADPNVIAEQERGQAYNQSLGIVTSGIREPSPVKVL